MPDQQQPTTPAPEPVPTQTPVTSIDQTAPETSPVVMGEAQPQTGTPQPVPQFVSATQLSTKKKKKLGLMAIIVAVLLVVIGGSAGAYYGVIVPNKPENILQTAIKNTALQKKAKFSGKFSIENTEEGAPLKAVNISMNGQSDLDNHAFQIVTEVTASGIKIPLEIRGVDKSLFFKVGDLSTLEGLASAASPEMAPLVGQVSKKVADKWIEIDETLLKQANLSCSLDTDYSLTKEDVDILIKRYKEVPFATVKSSSDTVDGKAAIKYDIEVDDNKGADYAKGLDQISVVKKLKECNKSDSFDTKSLADNDKTPLTLWVNKSSKQIVKLQLLSTAKDEQEDHMKGSFEISMQYGEASISKPDGAIPLMQIIGELGTVLGGSPLGETLGVSTEDTTPSE